MKRTFATEDKLAETYLKHEAAGDFIEADKCEIEFLSIGHLLAVTAAALIVTAIWLIPMLKRWWEERP